MEYTSCAVTDTGIRKETNQDRGLIKEAVLDGENILFAAICDGMGGMDEGETAAEMMTDALSDWFDSEAAGLTDGDPARQKTKVYASFSKIVKDTNDKIRTYARNRWISCGTTLTGILFLKNRFYTVNVGDSRVYAFRNGIHRLTKDQTYIQMEIDAGRLTEEEAETHPKRSLLLQCVGACEDVEPIFSSGGTRIGDLYMLCSDGFRHKITEKEFEGICDSREIVTEDDLRDISTYLIELNKNRGEQDNISVIMIKLSKY